MRGIEQQPAAIEEEVCRGLLLWFAEGFGLKEGQNLFYSPGTHKAMRAALVKMKQEGQQLTYPMAFMRLSDVTRGVSNTAYNPKSLARHGVFVRTDDKDRRYVRKLHPIRVDMTFDVYYATDDHAKALRYASLWMSLGQENRLNFTVNYYGTAVDIAARLSDSITMPEKEEGVDEEINAYEFTSSIVAEGYVTAQHPDNDSDIPLVNNIQVRATPVGNVDQLRNDSRVLNAALKRSSA